MKAVVHKSYGPPSVAKLQEIPKPTPQENELLVRVHATTVNRTDAGFRSAEYFISRFWSGLFKPKFNVLGCEFSGTIEGVGKSVSAFNLGDRVFGFNEKSFGGHAEYLTIPESAAVITMPVQASFQEAAAFSEGFHYALNDIRAAKVKSGQKVLVNGATGAIGSAAVQLLKHFGAHVTAVCNTKNVELVKGLGADVVIDYQNQDFTVTENKFDFIFDAVGKSSFSKCKPLLNNKGIYISTELGKYGSNVFYALLTPIWVGKKVLFPIPTISKDDLEIAKVLFQKGAFRPVIDRYFNLTEIVEAYTYVETGQKTGNVVIRVID
jgi:NADPH:quinone reductase-like Zn-dependent oxidoreductase